MNHVHHVTSCVTRKSEIETEADDGENDQVHLLIHGVEDKPSRPSTGEGAAKSL